MKIDIEQHLLAIQARLQSQLNTDIAALNTEKNDSCVLKTVSNDAYCLQTLNDKVANWNPFILLGVTDIETLDGLGPATLKRVVFEVVIIVADTELDDFIGQRMLRYGRVLEDLFNRDFAKIIPSANFKVNSLVPVAITAINSNDPYRAVGVQVVANIG